MRLRAKGGIEKLVGDVLCEINTASPGNFKPLTQPERAQIAANIANVWYVWCEYKNAPAIVLVPWWNDEKINVSNLKTFIDARDDAAAAVLTRVLDDRLWLEIRRVRGTLGKACSPYERMI